MGASGVVGASATGGGVVSPVVSGTGGVVSGAGSSTGAGAGGITSASVEAMVKPSW